jgi:hypothetical protein
LIRRSPSTSITATLNGSPRRSDAATRCDRASWSAEQALVDEPPRQIGRQPAREAAQVPERIPRERDRALATQEHHRERHRAVVRQRHAEERTIRPARPRRGDQRGRELADRVAQRHEVGDHGVRDPTRGVAGGLLGQEQHAVVGLERARDPDRQLLQRRRQVRAEHAEPEELAEEHVQVQGRPAGQDAAQGRLVVVREQDAVGRHRGRRRWQ